MEAMVLLNSTALSAFSDAKNSDSLCSFNISTIFFGRGEKKIHRNGIENWATVVLLNESGSEESHRGPYQQA